MRAAKCLAASAWLLAVAALPASAATDKPTAGVEAGVSFSRVSPDAADETVTRRAGALVGVYVLLPRAITKTIGLQVEAIYNQKDSRLALPSGTVDQKLEYVALPVLAKLPLFKGFYMLEGVSFDLPVKATLRPASGSAQNITNQITSPDVALVIGGGRPIRRAAIEFRYEGGFKVVGKAGAEAAQRNRSLSGLLRVHF
jgi:hypothetical protein